MAICAASRGYPATALYGGIDSNEIRSVEREIVAGRHHLVFVAPERLLTPRFLELVVRLCVGSLRELARLRPASLGRLRAVRDLGERRLLLDLGSRLLERIAEHERKRNRAGSHTNRDRGDRIRP